jgi:hypothetical protein
LGKGLRGEGIHGLEVRGAEQSRAVESPGVRRTREPFRRRDNESLRKNHYHHYADPVALSMLPTSPRIMFPFSPYLRPS